MWRRTVRPSLVGALALAGLLALVGGVLPGPGATSRAVAQPSAEAEPTPQTDASVPAQRRDDDRRDAGGSGRLGGR